MKTWLLLFVLLLLAAIALVASLSFSSAPPPLLNADMSAAGDKIRIPPPPGSVPYPSAPSMPSPPARQLYAWRCSACHGADGQAQTYTAQYPGMPSVGNLATGNRSHEEITGILTSGRGAMPSFQNRLSPQDRENLSNYIIHHLRQAQ